MIFLETVIYIITIIFYSFNSTKLWKQSGMGSIYTYSHIFIYSFSKNFHNHKVIKIILPEKKFWLVMNLKDLFLFQTLSYMCTSIFLWQNTRSHTKKCLEKIVPFNLFYKNNQNSKEFTTVVSLSVLKTYHYILMPRV